MVYVHRLTKKESSNPNFPSKIFCLKIDLQYGGRLGMWRTPSKCQAITARDIGEQVTNFVRSLQLINCPVGRAISVRSKY